MIQIQYEPCVTVILFYLGCSLAVAHVNRVFMPTFSHPIASIIILFGNFMVYYNLYNSYNHVCSQSVYFLLFGAFISTLVFIYNLFITAKNRQNRAL